MLVSTTVPMSGTNAFAYGICVESLEEVNSSLEEICNFRTSSIARVAIRIEGRNACSVFGPFVLPETLSCTVIAHPVRLHVREERGFTEGVENLGDVRVCSRCVAVRIVGTVAMVGPEAVNCP
jgi:hypothetical protein